MTQKDKQLLTELVLTSGLLVASGFLLKPAAFWQFQLILLGGIVLGFAFSWYNRKRIFEGIKYFADAAILITLIWIGYRIFKSTFLYKEVIAILIQGVIILEIIFSFNFSAPGKAAYLRLLSLLIFMTSPVFAVAYNLPLAIAYLLVWLAILRFQFAGYRQPVPVKEAQRYYSLICALVCFLIAIILAWFISSNIFLGRIDKGKLLLDEDMEDMESGGGIESSQANKFYSLQDDLQSKLTDLALKLDTYEKSRQLVYLFSELVKETAKTMEMDKAETGLVDILKREGPGLEGSVKAMDLIKSYSDKKNSRNLQKNKDGIMDMLRNFPLGVIDKIKIISLANKVQQSNSYQQLQDNSQGLQSAIKHTSLNKSAQKDLSALARQLSNLKAFELYRRQMRDLEQRPASFDKETEEKISGIISDIKHTGSLDDFKQTAKKIRQLKNDSSILEQKSGEEVIKKLEEVSRIKLDLLFGDQSAKLRKDAEQKQDLGGQAEEFGQKMDGAENAASPREFIEEFSKLSRQNRDDNLGLAAGLSQMLGLKTESFKQKQKDKLDSLVNKNLPNQAKKEITEALEAMEEKESSRDLEKQLEDLAAKIKELERKGDLSPEAAAQLLTTTAELGDLLSDRLEAEKELEDQDASEKDGRKPDYLEQLRQAIEDSSLSDQDKKALKDLAEELLKAHDLSQLEDVKEAEKKYLSSLESSAVNKINEKFSQASQIKQQFLMSKILADILEKIEKLSLQNAKQAQALKAKLKELRQSNTSEEVEKVLQELNNILNSQDAQEEKENGLQGAGKQQCKIYILPVPLVVSAGTTLPLKVLAVYKNGYIKELSSDVDWFLSDPRIVRIDETNSLYPLTGGKAKIKAVYKGASSQDTEVNVVEDIDGRIAQMIKRELVQ
ncbi:MAG TPA: hypothetical protein PL125_03010 [Candidatus Omnitrophota bacterium]|nr:hypothetical protein [Candidatus Omnitrophota bacterium]